MNYHRYRFGLRRNFKFFLCRAFGHRLNEKAEHNWCERCGLAYSECYDPQDYYNNKLRYSWVVRLCREVIMRANVALPLNEKDERWFHEKFDHKKTDVMIDIAEFLEIEH